MSPGIIALFVGAGILFLAAMALVVVTVTRAIGYHRAIRDREAALAGAPIGVGLIEGIHRTLWTYGSGPPGGGAPHLYRFDVRVETEDGRQFTSRVERYLSVLERRDFQEGTLRPVHYAPGREEEAVFVTDPAAAAEAQRVLAVVQARHRR
ncbi:hypothetical protein GSY69_02130 [Brevibacterium sp. 5221]|uniref:DUF3592 domain-containing protein n=1 Tax=Brevibacterium rongguiense TaxID=2695267 RepID=A0A6N9H431_9MICO|nr:hypothetical protein [Brevibacterium rongguiense]MYM18808.1 hypothetical protein [Brevibacterium rongguiense]